MDGNAITEGISGLFNLASVGVAGVTALAVGGAAFLFGRPKMIKPDSKTAFVVTGFKFPKVTSTQFVVRNKPQAVWRFGLSEPEAVSQQSFTVNVSRKGIRKGGDGKEGLREEIREEWNGQKDESLVLKDNIKAEVDVDFYVQVDTEDSPDGPDGKKGLTGDQKIILAKRTLGEINEKSLKDYLLPKADSALRAAAAQMTIEEIQGNREKFLENVKANISLAEHGLKVTDAALRDFRQAPKESFDPNDYFASQGLKLVTEKANASLKAVNDSNQITQTQIAQKTQEQTIERLTITQAQTQATLAQQKEIERLTAEQARQVKEIQAEQRRAGDIAAIVATQQTQERDIEMQRQIAVANAQREQATKVAQEQAEQAAATARIAKEQAVEIANREKDIALQAKAALVAQAEQATNLKKAEAVIAEQEVITAKETAEADREKKVAVIQAEKTAQEAAAGMRIDADVQVYVAEKGAEAKKKQGEGIQILATAEAAAAKTKAEGDYAAEYQPLKAKADGKLADASAQKALNDAVNALSDAARAFQVDLKRVEITPEVVQAFVAGMASIDNFNVTSINGAPGSNGAAGVNGVMADGSNAGGGNVFEQFYGAARNNMIQASLVKRIITDMGGDPSVADNLPGLAAPTPVVPVDAGTVPSAEAIDTQSRAAMTARSRGPSPK